MIGDHDVSQLATAELERAKRDLHTNLGLITQGSLRMRRSRLTCGQSTPSLPNVPSTRMPMEVQPWPGP